MCRGCLTLFLFAEIPPKNNRLDLLSKATCSSRKTLIEYVG